MSLRTLSPSFLLEKGAMHTAREIDNQPALWKRTADDFFAQAAALSAFMQEACAGADNIILTGAGTSAFIGLSLEGAFFSNTGKLTRAVATTDIVSHPHHYFNKKETPLIISFARSGNSPESIATLELADHFCKKCFHVITTCSQDGALAKYSSKNPVYTFVLPEEANDKSLAMTGSYSSMLLMGLLLAYIGEPQFCRSQLKLVTAAAENILDHETDKIKQIAAIDFERAVFLGSGPLFGTAKEAALKLQELTDGRIICKSDSYLGFRHGPKAVVDDTTLVVYFFNNDPYVQQYENDLLHAMKTGNQAMLQVAVSERELQADELNAQVSLGGDEHEPIAEDFLPVCGIVVGQLLGFFKSLQCGLMPDAPSASGAISRVVKGVNIYPVIQ